jgi:hydrogenase maturation protein HypF
MPVTLHLAAAKRMRFEVRGIVQGVGFRPFVYNLARSSDLGWGYVLNSSAGVILEVEGSEENLASFQQRLRTELPPLAQIDELTVREVNSRGDHEFCIQHSVSAADEFALVSPDVATCNECCADSSAEDNRRLGYPFTNCTNCGPLLDLFGEPGALGQNSSQHAAFGDRR